MEQRSESLLEKSNNTAKRDSFSSHRGCRFPDSSNHAFLRPSRFPAKIYEPNFCFRLWHCLSLFKYGSIDEGEKELFQALSK